MKYHVAISNYKLCCVYYTTCYMIVNKTVFGRNKRIE